MHEYSEYHSTTFNLPTSEIGPICPPAVNNNVNEMDMRSAKALIAMPWVVNANTSTTPSVKGRRHESALRSRRTMLNKAGDVKRKREEKKKQLLNY